MKLIQIQIALFSKGTISRPDLVFNEANQKMAGIIDTMPNIINLPMDTPGDFPIVSSASGNGRYSINVSRTRVDFVIRPEFEKESTPAEVLKEYQSLVSKYYKAVAGAMPITRVGVIFTLFEFADNNVHAIFEKHFKKEYSPAFSEASLKYNRQSQVKGIIMNNVVSIDATNLQSADREYPGVLFVLDINNVPSSELVLSAEDIAEIYKQASMRLKTSELKELI